MAPSHPLTLLRNAASLTLLRNTAAANGRPPSAATPPFLRAPPAAQLQQAWDFLRGAAALEDERALVERQAEGSWTARDVDVRMDAGAGVLLSGDARWVAARLLA